jgi:hypothetical protein
MVFEIVLILLSSPVRRAEGSSFLRGLEGD